MVKGNMYKMLIVMNTGDFPEDSLCRRFSENVFNEAVNKGYIIYSGKKDEWGHRFYHITQTGKKERDA